VTAKEFEELRMTSVADALALIKRGAEEVIVEEDLVKKQIGRAHV